VQAKLWNGDTHFPFFAIHYTLNTDEKYTDFGDDEQIDFSISAQLDQFTDSIPENDSVIEIVDDKKYQVKSHKIKLNTIILNLGKYYS
jgi:hypothetical protein